MPRPAPPSPTSVSRVPSARAAVSGQMSAKGKFNIVCARVRLNRSGTSESLPTTTQLINTRVKYIAHAGHARTKKEPSKRERGARFTPPAKSPFPG